MSYHKFSNLREILQGDLNSKLMRGIGSKDFEDLPCNCSATSKSNGACVYNGKCRQYVVIYKAICKDCNAFYIGNTSTHLKKRMNQHFDDVKRLVSKGSQSDSYAKHFAEHFEKGAKLTNKMVRENVEMEVI